MKDYVNRVELDHVNGTRLELERIVTRRCPVKIIVQSATSVHSIAPLAFIMNCCNSNSLVNNIFDFFFFQESLHDEAD